MIAIAHAPNERARTRRAEPTRTCVGCRERAPAEELLRVVASPETPPRVVVDVRRRLPGRGASVHPSRRCLETAVKRRALARALRVDGLDVRADALAVDASDAYLRRAEALLGAAHRAGMAVYGTDVVRQAVRDRRVVLLVVAADALGRREELEAAMSGAGDRTVSLGTKETLGRVFGRAEVGVAGVLDPSFARSIRDAASRAAALSEAV